MPLFAPLERHREPEIMDQPDLEPARHVQALRGLARINQWSGSARILWPAIRAYAMQNHLPSLRILDIATGGGDVPLALWRKGRRANFSMALEGWDISPCAVTHAQARAAEEQAPVCFARHDVMKEPIPTRFDIITCSLFLHHLSEDQAVQLLEKMAQATQGMILVNDLIRSHAGLALALVGTRMLSSSQVVHVDGPRSVRAAYTLGEVQRLAGRAGLSGHSLTAHWPYRFLLAWMRQ